MTDIAELAGRLAALEAEQERRAQVVRNWLAKPLEERLELLAAGLGYTTPDSLPWVTDYNQPADVPALSKLQADAIQAALDKRAYTGRISGTHEIAPWQGYTVVTAVDPNWQNIGQWLEIQPISQDGYFRVVMSGYLNPTGGTSAGLGVMFGIRRSWNNGSSVDWSNGRLAALGRATAPQGQTLNMSGIAEGWIANVRNARLRILPEAQKLTNPAGGSAQVGEFRATVTFYPAMTALGATVLP